MDNKILGQDLDVTAKLAVGCSGVCVGLIDHIVNVAQVISIVGGAIIVIITLYGMAASKIKKLSK